MEKRQKFTAEFKREAVRQVRDAGKSVSVVARELGIARNRLYKWASEAERFGASAFAGSGRRPDDEIDRLRREVERLKEENEILKKAAAYFAKGLP